MRTRIWSAAFRYCSWWVTRILGLFFRIPQIHLERAQAHNALYIYMILLYYTKKPLHLYCPDHFVVLLQDMSKKREIAIRHDSSPTLG